MTDAQASGTQSRTAIVTGGARGIGAAIARRLSADGFSVAVLDLDEAGAKDTAAAIAEAGGRAIGVAADVSDEEAVRAAVTQVAAELGPPLVVVNNAGVTRDNLIFKMSATDWDMVMNVHLRGAFLVTKAAQGYMVEARYGRIVNVSSTSALGNRGQVNYSAAKAGLQGFTKTLAIELGKYGVTANSVAPGFIDTDMTRATAARLGLDPDEHMKNAAARTPVGRVGQPEDIANVVSFFVDERSGFVSGQVIYAAGGPRA
jgi:3-oxoacyl-[acyl-carrier protein] reductase